MTGTHKTLKRHDRAGGSSGPPQGPALLMKQEFNKGLKKDEATKRRRPVSTVIRSRHRRKRRHYYATHSVLPVLGRGRETAARLADLGWFLGGLTAGCRPSRC